MVATQTIEPSYEPAPQADSHLRDYVQVLLRRRRIVVAVFTATVALATLRTLLTKPVYEGTAQLLIEKQNPNVLNFQGVAQDNQGGYGIDDYYQTQYKLLQSRSLARRVIEKFNLLNNPEYGGPREKDQIDAILAQPPGQSPELEGAISGVLARTTVQPVRNSRLVNVSVTSGRPELAATATNALAQLYIQQSLDLRFEISSEAGQWLGAQIEEQRKKAEEADLRLQELKRQEGLVNIDERRTLLDQRLKELGTAFNERKTDRLQKEALWRQMASAPNPEELPGVMQSGLVQNLRIEFASLERQQAQLLERYLDQHPEVLKVRNQIQDTRAKIRGEAQHVIRAAANDYKAAAAQEASVAAALESAKHETLQLGARAVSYDTQKREVDAARQVLDSLMSRAKQTDVASELKSTNIRVVDAAAVPGGPIRPRKLRDISLGVLLGAFLSLGFAFFLEYLDNTLKTPDDVRQHLGAPLLGVVPELTEDKHPNLVILNTNLDQRFVEGYRVIRTALNYSWSEPGARIITVTSTAPGEGKTLTAVNLARTLGAQEGRTLLIDADLRKPSTQQLVRGRESPGLSDVLVGKAKASEAIQTRLKETDLAYLSSGTHVPSPAGLLTNRTMRGLLEGQRTFYDWIIIDTPPVGAVSEPLILAPLTDGVVLVTGAEMVPRKAVLHTLERIHDTARASWASSSTAPRSTSTPTTTATTTGTTPATTEARPRQLPGPPAGATARVPAKHPATARRPATARLLATARRLATVGQPATARRPATVGWPATERWQGSMEPVPAPNGNPCHSERVRPAVARGIRSLSALLLLSPLALLAPSCEKLPNAPNIPPTASFIYNPVAPINAGDTPVTFTAVGSHDIDGTIVSFNWTWGDGTPEQTTTSPTTTHVFADTPLRCINATYSVLLTVTDNKGDTGTASQQVTVTELPAPGSLECSKP